MQLIIKILFSLALILAATWIGRKYPSTAGLVATMPLTGLIVLLLLYMDSDGDRHILTEYSEGAFWGILPSILFFLAVFLLLKRHLPFPVILPLAFGCWLAGAVVHQWLLR
jgi:uncharacterized membrane protein (GlpM family)